MPRLVVTLAILLGACDHDEPSTPAPAPPRGPAEPTRKAPDGPPAPPPAVAAVGEDWLVWHATPTGFHTRWIDATVDDFTVVVERDALIVGDRERLWRIERDDGEVELRGCACTTSACAGSRMASAGLKASGLAGTRDVDIQAPSRSDRTADEIETSLRITGGVGSHLFYAVGEGAYACDAHATRSEDWHSFDLRRARSDDVIVVGIGEHLPPGVRSDAIASVTEALERCGHATSDLEDALALRGLGLALYRGRPTIAWQFTIDGPSWCAWDRGLHAEVTTDLLLEGAQLGLAGPLPGGVTRALDELREAEVFGWGRLELAPQMRSAAILAMSGAPDTPWPSSTIRAAAPLGDDPRELVPRRRRARALLREGDHAGAIEVLDRIVADDPRTATVLSERAWAHLLAGNLDLADADAAAAVALTKAPRLRASVLYLQGLVAERRGDRKTSAKAYRAALALGRDRELEAALTRVSKR